MFGQHKTVLITGGAGFIGSHLVSMLVQRYPSTSFYNLDLLTYAADLSRLRHLEDKNNYHFIKADIRDAQHVHKLFQSYKFDGVFHLAAESHVDNSIKDPKIFLETNIIGTFNVLSAAKELWSKQPQPYYRFLHVSTDEVYGSLGKTGLFSETTPYAPNSPYSVSKASSDMIVRSFFHTYRLPVVITNCSNNYGPNQHKEKLIPLVIDNAIKGQPIPIYGNGKNIRDWLYVEDHCDALIYVFQKGLLGESYNIGTRNEKTNLEIVYLICDILERLLPSRDNEHLVNINYHDLIIFVEDRKGHDFRYAIDGSKLSDLGWQAKNQDFKKALEVTVKSYIQ